jgi:hypothetical protein
MTEPLGRRISFSKFDFPAMVASDAAWRIAASRIAVLTIGLHTIERYPDLNAVVAMTKRNHFKVATAGSMVFTDGVCEKKGMEGMDPGEGYAREVVNGIKVWKDHGGRLDYLIMDSPFYFGYYESAKDCQYSINEVAQRAAATFKVVQKAYPDIKVMDAEGPGAVPVNMWLPEFGRWLQAFGAYAGHPVDLVGLDFHWRDAWHTGYDWISAVRTTAGYLHRMHIGVGLFINAEDKDVTERKFFDATRDHLQVAIGAKAGLDFVYLASWMKFPSRNLPETDPQAYTSLIDQAFKDLLQ